MNDDTINKRPDKPRVLRAPGQQDAPPLAPSSEPEAKKTSAATPKPEAKAAPAAAPEDKSAPAAAPEPEAKANPEPTDKKKKAKEADAAVNPHKLKREENARKKAEAEARKQAVVDAIKVNPPAPKARPRRRHWGVLASFVIFVIGPLYLVWFYLQNYAEDQYVSHIGFAVRTEETSSAMELLGGLSQISSASSSDPDILYEFIQSQELVARIDEKLDLRAIYSKPENDPIYAFDDSGTIEDLVDHWARMVRINYDGTAGMLQLRVLAFDPDDAHAIATAIFEESSAKINELSAIARADATRYAREELDLALDRLKAARRAITGFRTEHQLVSPQDDIQGQVGLQNSLQQQLAEALIELDLLTQTARDSDPRIAQLNRRISAIEVRIEAERSSFSQATSASGKPLSVLVGEFEELDVDLEFAQEAYLSALSGFDQAKAEAQRQSRYLAPFITPTRAERSTYPRRTTIMGIAAVFVFLSWATAVLIAYALKDRK